ncbi:MAG TPA: pantoate--beta-alanine ligase [Propionicimonas sp.]
MGLVPTMGAFHEGHLSLIRAARATCDLVVVWLFVNPTQFNEAADLAGYPRDEERDAAQAAECGADILFAPEVEAVYPTGFATIVTVSGVTDVLEGVHRPGHFAGVATRRGQDAQHGRAGRRLLRRQGRPTGCRGEADGGRPRHPDPHRGAADRPRSRRVGHEQP